MANLQDSASQIERDFYRLTVERTQRTIGDLLELAPDGDTARAILSAAFNQCASNFVAAAIIARRTENTPANRAAAFRLAAKTLAAAFEEGRL